MTCSSPGSLSVKTLVQIPMTEWSKGLFFPQQPEFNVPYLLCCMVLTIIILLMVLSCWKFVKSSMNKEYELSKACKKGQVAQVRTSKGMWGRVWARHASMSIEQGRQVWASGASMKRREAGGCGTGFAFSLTSTGDEDNTCAGWEYIAFNRGGRTAKNIGEAEQKQQKNTLQRPTGPTNCFCLVDMISLPSTQFVLYLVFHVLIF